MSISLESKAYDAIRYLNEASEKAKKYCDHGSILGIREELKDIEENLNRNLGDSVIRSLRLLAKIDKWESGDHEVGMVYTRKNNETSQ